MWMSLTCNDYVSINTINCLNLRVYYSFLAEKLSEKYVLLFLPGNMLLRRYTVDVKLCYILNY